MTNKRIRELADFFYSSNSSNDVPLRISIVSGMYSGATLTKEKFIKLLSILSASNCLKKDLLKFREEVEDEE